MYNMQQPYPQSYNNPYPPITQQYIDRLSYISGQQNNNAPQPTQLIKVNGMESAKAYQTQPNSTVALFDSNEDIMYVKSTDASNFPSIRRFRFIEEKEQVEQPKEQYVTMNEFNKFKEEILNGKQSVQQPTTNAYTTSNDGQQQYVPNAQPIQTVPTNDEGKESRGYY